MPASRFLNRRRTSLVFSAVLMMSFLSGTATATTADLIHTDSHFLEQLPADEKKGLDLTKLSPEQVSALDAYAEREIRFAREGGVSAFSSTFTQRRSLKERERAGLDRLNPGEWGILDTIVARAIATPPAFSYRPAHALGNEAVDSYKRPFEVHGSVSLTVGAGSGGRSFYGGAFETTIEDPDHRFALSLGYAEYHFKGRSRYDGYGYGYGGYGYGPGYGFGPGLGYGYGFDCGSELLRGW